ncbi:MAG: response regulator [Prochloraceae cyanobacterium]
MFMLSKLVQNPSQGRAPKISASFPRRLDGVEASESPSPLIRVNAPLIACIDDSPSVGQILSEIFQEYGYRFLGIQEAVKAPLMLLRVQPDLIFLDVRMPQINGYQLCSLLRQMSGFKKVPILFFSSNDSIIDVIRARTVGANGYLSKKASQKEALDVVKKLLGHR